MKKYDAKQTVVSESMIDAILENEIVSEEEMFSRIESIMLEITSKRNVIMTFGEKLIFIDAMKKGFALAHVENDIT